MKKDFQNNKQKRIKEKVESTKRWEIFLTLLVLLAGTNLFYFYDEFNLLVFLLTVVMLIFKASISAKILFKFYFMFLHGIDIIIGGQWGDEGKGKDVDALAANYDIVAKVNGGTNAGHTVVVDGKEYKFHVMTSAMIHPHIICHIGHGVLFDPIKFEKEMNTLIESGINLDGRITISSRTQIVLPIHIVMDVVTEEEKEKTGNKIGTTKSGMGPAHASGCLRDGIRMDDLINDDFTIFENKFNLMMENALRRNYIKERNFKEEQEYLHTMRRLATKYRPMVVPLEWIHEQYHAGKKILVECSNAVHIDKHTGTWPYVTSGSCLIGGVLDGLGVSHNMLGRIIGQKKAYLTRVGNGVTLTRMPEYLESYVQETGHEFGTTTKRRRFCCHNDGVMDIFADTLIAFDEITMNKFDCLPPGETVKLCVGYKNKKTGKLVQFYPSSVAELQECEPIYEEFEGWTEIVSNITKYHKLPLAMRKYIDRMEELTGTPITTIGVGPERTQTIKRACGYSYYGKLYNALF